MQGENYLNAAYAYLYIRDFQRASEAFQRAIASDPDNPEYYFHASVTALRNECHELAMDWAKTAAALEPKNMLYREHLHVVEAAARTHRGYAALLEGALDIAIEHFEAALEADPLNVEAAHSLRLLRQDNGVV